ncbi:MAG: hypothetical protein H6807_02880 [Planctomycetes bacterium]|nr:hypothetical protein [Planctomycetota bacterium]
MTSMRIEPDWLLDQKLAAIIEAAKLSDDERAALDKPKRDSSKSNKAEFLRTDGRRIWEEILISSLPPHILRNHRPFTDEELARIREATRSSFASDGHAGADAAPPIAGQESGVDWRKSRRFRFWTGIILVVIGFAVIIGIYFLLPWISEHLRGRDVKDKITTIDRDLRELQASLAREDFENLTKNVDAAIEQIGRLDAETVGIPKLHDGMMGVKSRLEAAVMGVNERIKAIDGVAEGLKDLLQQMKAATEQAPEGADPAAGGTGPLGQRIKNLDAFLKKSTTDREFTEAGTELSKELSADIKAIDTLRGHIEAMRDARRPAFEDGRLLNETDRKVLDGKSDDLRDSTVKTTKEIEQLGYFGKSTSADLYWRYFTREQAVALGRLLAAANAPEIDLQGTIDRISQHGQTWLEKVEKVRLDEQDRKVLESLSGALTASSATAKTMDEAAAELKSSTERLGEEISQISGKSTESTSKETPQTPGSPTERPEKDSNPLEETRRAIVDLRSRILTANNHLATSRAFVDDAKEVTSRLRDLEDATKKLVEYQYQVAFEGASPAIWLLFAIGGMFVTFGMTSVLKSVRLLELERAEKTWRRRARGDAVLATALLSVGIDPDVVMRAIHVGLPADDSESIQVATPISQTIGEIAKAIRAKP